MLDTTKACAVCGYPVPDHSALCSAGRPEKVEMCPCGDMTDRECREANRKAAESSGSVCCARFRDSAPALPPSRPRAGEDDSTGYPSNIGEAADGAANLLAHEVPALRRVITTLRARLAAAERALGTIGIEPGDDVQPGWWVSADPGPVQCDTLAEALQTFGSLADRERETAARRAGAEAQRALDSDWLRDNGYTEAADMLRLATLFPEAPDA